MYFCVNLLTFGANTAPVPDKTPPVNAPNAPCVIASPATSFISFALPAPYNAPKPPPCNAPPATLVANEAPLKAPSPATGVAIPPAISNAIAVLGFCLANSALEALRSSRTPLYLASCTSAFCCFSPFKIAVSCCACAFCSSVLPAIGNCFNAL